MKIASWNVNGLRSVSKTTFFDWLAKSRPDIVCLQEIKAECSLLAQELIYIPGYYSYFNSAQKKGYSGVAVYTKIKPLAVETRMGIDRFDMEGRVLKLIFKDFVLFNLYIPHGGRAKDKLEYKLQVYKSLCACLSSYTDQDVVLAGDFNIAHTELDLYYPKQNFNNNMFTPIERKQLDMLVAMGFRDSFRKIYPDTKAYTMWPNAFHLRERDIGWRIDYIYVTRQLEAILSDAYIEKDVLGSDHAPLGIVLNKEVVIDEIPPSPPKIQTSLF